MTDTNVLALSGGRSARRSLQLGPGRSPRRSKARPRRAGGAAGLLLFFAWPLAHAQGPVHVSTSSSAQVGSLSFDDSALLVANGAVRPYFVEGHWMGTSGFVPTDIDGFGRRPGFPAGSARSMAFSLLSNEQGFLDGDVLSFAPGGGLEVVVSEDQLLQGLGVPSGNVDVDALDFDAQGELLFSLQSDLGGTSLGMVEDGDVLRLRQDGSVTVEVRETDVQQLFTAATGLADAINDVQAVEWAFGSLLVVTQSPSSHDGAVLSLNPTASILVEEAQMGVGGAEIDALSFVTGGDEIPCFTLAPSSAQPGDSLQFTAYGDPNSLQVVLPAGSTGWTSFAAAPGFGAWYLDPADPWLTSSLSGPTLYAVLGPGGSRSGTWALPTAPVHGLGFGGESGWSFQVLSLPSFELSAPFRVVKP